MEIKNKKSIGILTMPIKENYGGIIQAAALYHFLEVNGFTPYLVMKKYDEGILKRCMRYILSHNPFAFIFDYKSLTKRERQVVLLDKFINEFFLNKTETSYNKKVYVNSIKHLDSIVVGSDQVWRYNYIGENYPYYFLAYLPETVDKIAYAASFGVDKWEGNAKSIIEIEKLLNKFKGVSVRESTGVNLCKETFKYNKAIHVLDPTFLPDLAFYNDLIDRKNITKEISLFSYVLDKSEYIDKIITAIEQEKKLNRTLIELTNYSDSVKPSIEEWLYHFREAKYVVTDSFHGVVFCILFQKQFVCVANKDRGIARFQSLLNSFNLTDRIVVDYNELEIKKLLLDIIDYDSIEIVKSLLVSEANFYLLENLK